MLRRVGLILVASVLAQGGSASAGEFGLIVDDSLTTAGERALNHSRNSCRSDAVLSDLRAYHVEGKARQIAAVRVGLAHCTVSFRSKEAREGFYRGLGELLAAPRVTDEKALLHVAECVPFEGRRSEIAVRLKQAGLSEVARGRLERELMLIAKPSGE